MVAFLGYRVSLRLGDGVIHLWWYCETLSILARFIFALLWLGWWGCVEDILSGSVEEAGLRSLVLLRCFPSSNPVCAFMRLLRWFGFGGGLPSLLRRWALGQ
jgi:hypothetical protein